MSESLSEKSLSGLIWVMVDKVAGSSVNFIINIILARLLLPEDFGLVAMVMIFFELSSVFVESGFSTALIRQKEITEVDKSTTFIFNLLMAVTLYVVLFFGAPAIAAFFDQEKLTWIIRILGLNVVINAFAIIQLATLTQKIDFKTQTKVRFLAVLSSGSAGVVMALMGFGVWSLVAKLVIMTLVNTLMLWVFNPWNPSWRFSVSAFRRLFNFGYRLLLEALLNKFFLYFVQLLIGKFFSAATLGYYTQADSFKNMASNTVFHAINKVTYPVLAKLKDNTEKLRGVYRKVIKMSSFVILPGMILLGTLAKPLIVFIVGEKWLPAVPFLQLLCVSGATYHLNSINLNMLLTIGRVDIALRLEIIKKVILGTAIVIGLQFGIYGLLVGEIVSSYIALFINSYYSEKFLNYSFLDQVKDIIPSLVISLITGAVVLLTLNAFSVAEVFHIFMGLGVGTGLYLGLHLLMKTEEIGLIRRLVIPRTMQLIAKFR